MNSLRETAKAERRSLTAQAIRHLEEAEGEAKRKRITKRYGTPNPLSRAERMKRIAESIAKLDKMREGKPPPFRDEAEIDEIINDHGYTPFPSVGDEERS